MPSAASGSATRSRRAARAGYDHKEMGITARGAWESVRRHFRHLGIDADRDDFTVVGIGDMSGDVFGNGMLLSQHIRARRRVRPPARVPRSGPRSRAVVRRSARGCSSCPRSSWADYDPALISPGGGVYPRTAKSIAITAEVRARARHRRGDRRAARPTELIRAILRAPVDLLYNGGIGTYVKARTETHADVGDKANDALRVDGAELRCRVVGEGGNLGFTQRGRVEYALARRAASTPTRSTTAPASTRPTTR